MSEGRHRTKMKVQDVAGMAGLGLAGNGQAGQGQDGQGMPRRG